MFFEYLRDYFIRSSFGETCIDTWRQVKYYQPLLNNERRKLIWPKFKKMVKDRKKARLLRPLWPMIFFGVALLVLARLNFPARPIICFLCLVCGLFYTVVLPIANLWQLREIFHEANLSVQCKPKKSPRDEQSAAQSKDTAAVGTKDQPIRSGLTPRRQPPRS